MSDQDQIRFERIELYLQGKMTPHDRESFEAEMLEDEALKNEVQVQRELQLTVEMGGMMEAMDEIHENIQGQKSNSFAWWKIAAALAVVVGLTLWLTNMKSKEENLFAEYVTHEPGLPVPMSATTDYNFYDAMVDYKSQKYEKAIDKWTLILEEYPGNDTLQYFIASAHFNLEQFEVAQKDFLKVTNDTESAFRSKAQWYRTLCLLRLNKGVEVKAVSPLPDSEYSDQIRAIQKTL